MSGGKGRGGEEGVAGEEETRGRQEMVWQAKGRKWKEGNEGVRWNVIRIETLRC